MDVCLITSQLFVVKSTSFSESLRFLTVPTSLALYLSLLLHETKCDLNVILTDSTFLRSGTLL